MDSDRTGHSRASHDNVTEVSASGINASDSRQLIPGGISHYDEPFRSVDQGSPMHPAVNDIEMRASVKSKDSVKLLESMMGSKKIQKMRSQFKKKISKQVFIDWMKKPLSKLEMDKAKFQIQLMHPLHDCDLLSMFPHLKQCILRCQSNVVLDDPEPCSIQQMEHYRNKTRKRLAAQMNSPDKKNGALDKIGASLLQTAFQRELAFTVQQEQFKQMLRPPKFYLAHLSQENRALSRIMRNLQEKLVNEDGSKSLPDYQGTDPIRDERKIYRKKKMEEHLLTSVRDKVTGKKLYKKLVGPDLEQLAKNEKAIRDDPFNLMGHGVKQFFRLLLNLTLTCLLLTVIVAPLFYFYSHHDGRDVGKTSSGMINMFHFSLGHLPAATTSCTHRFYSLKQEIELNCAGSVIDKEFYAGLLPAIEVLSPEQTTPTQKDQQVDTKNSAAANSGATGSQSSPAVTTPTATGAGNAVDQGTAADAKSTTAMTKVSLVGNKGRLLSSVASDQDDLRFDFCGDLAKQQKADSAKQCSQIHFNTKELAYDFKHQCAGLRNCKLDFDRYIMNVNGATARDCLQGNALIYLQYTCKLSKKMLRNNKNIALFAGFVCVCAMLAYRALIFWMRRSSHLEYAKWDMRTITASDFTVQIQLPAKAIEKWEVFEKAQADMNKSCDDEEGYNMLRDVIAKQIQEQVSEQEAALGMDAAKMVLQRNWSEAVDLEASKIEIACIYFGYDNGDLINLLEKRGAALASANMDDLKRLELRIKLLYQENYDRLRRPVTAFVTFTHQEGKERCVRAFGTSRSSFLEQINLNDEQKQLKIFDEPVECRPACEPSNVIWQNLGVTSGARLRMKFITLFANLTALILVFTLIAYAKADINKIYKSYPPLRDCEPIYSMFASGDKEKQKKSFAEYAAYDKNFIQSGQALGYYQCYCSKYSSWQDALKTFAEGKKDICADYLKLTYTADIWMNVLTVFIIVVNTLLRVINIKLVNTIGFEFRSEVALTTSGMQFLSMFVNTGFMLLISQANFEHAPIPFNYIGVRNLFEDFSADWYLLVGNQLIQTMLMQCFMPFFTVALLYLLGAVVRYWDSKSCGRVKDVEQTNACTVIQFVQIHAGPEAMIHYRYASLLTQTYVTFMYGLGMPILFPLLALYAFNLYLAERWLFIYVYQKPPLFGNSLTDMTLNFMAPAPILMIIFGYWQLGNRQIFFNEVQPLVNANDVRPCKHYYFDFSKGVDHTVPFLIYLLVIIFFDRFFKALLQFGFYCNCTERPRNYFEEDWKIENELYFSETLDERLGSYWKCLRGIDQKAWFARETYKRLLGFRSLDQVNYERLTTEKRAQGKCISDICNFDILSNPAYTTLFHYLNLSERHENITSDFVTKYLCLADRLVKKRNDIMFDASGEVVRKMTAVEMQSVIARSNTKWSDGFAGIDAPDTSKAFMAQMAMDKIRSYVSEETGASRKQEEMYAGMRRMTADNVRNPMLSHRSTDESGYDYVSKKSIQNLRDQLQMEDDEDEMEQRNIRDKRNSILAAIQAGAEEIDIGEIFGDIA